MRMTNPMESTALRDGVSNPEIGVRSAAFTDPIFPGSIRGGESPLATQEKIRLSPISDFSDAQAISHAGRGFSRVSKSLGKPVYTR